MQADDVLMQLQFVLNLRFFKHFFDTKEILNLQEKNGRHGP